MSNMQLKVAVLGADTFWSGECVRLLSRHPQAKITALISDESRGQQFNTIFPHLHDVDLPLIGFSAVDWDLVDVLISGLPHNKAQAYFKQIPERIRAIDLSADFRYRDTAFYETHYGPHQAAELQGQAVYGLPEFARNAIRPARIVGVPGCYPTASLLGLVPLLAAGMLEPDDIVIDAKSGVSGAGRGPDALHMYCEVADGVHAYRVGRHRLAQEIELGFSQAAGRAVQIAFTPHMVPMNRGTLVTMYARLKPGVDLEMLRSQLGLSYANEPFMRLLPSGLAPGTRMVRGSNYCAVNVFAERAHNRVVVLAAIDNVVKGAAGQALQCMNIMFGLPETDGLRQQPLFP